MKKINFEAGTQISPAKVTINNVDHEVTPAVWEGNTPLSPFVLNKMQDNIEDSINKLEKSDIYSTKEQVIGKWIDGKPIYRKIIVLTNVNTGYSAHLHNINNFSELIDIRGTYIDATGNFQKIPTVDIDNLNLFGISFANINNNSFAILLGTQRNNTNTIKVVLEYTKTTD